MLFANWCTKLQTTQYIINTHLKRRSLSLTQVFGLEFLCWQFTRGARDFYLFRENCLVKIRVAVCVVFFK